MVSLNFNFHRYTIRRHWNYIQLWGQRNRAAFACLSATAMWVAIDQPTSWSSNCSTLRPSYLFITNATCSVSCWLINRQAPHYHETIETLQKHKKMFHQTLTDRVSTASRAFWPTILGWCLEGRMARWRYIALGQLRYIALVASTIWVPDFGVRWMDVPPRWWGCYLTNFAMPRSKKGWHSKGGYAQKSKIMKLFHT